MKRKRDGHAKDVTAFHKERDQIPHPLSSSATGRAETRHRPPPTKAASNGAIGLYDDVAGGRAASVKSGGVVVADGKVDAGVGSRVATGDGSKRRDIPAKKEDEIDDSFEEDDDEMISASLTSTPLTEDETDDNEDHNENDNNDYKDNHEDIVNDDNDDDYEDDDDEEIKALFSKSEMTEPVDEELDEKTMTRETSRWGRWHRGRRNSKSGREMAGKENWTLSAPQPKPPIRASSVPHQRRSRHASTSTEEAPSPRSHWGAPWAHLAPEKPLSASSSPRGKGWTFFGEGGGAARRASSSRGGPTPHRGLERAISLPSRYPTSDKGSLARGRCPSCDGRFERGRSKGTRGGEGEVRLGERWGRGRKVEREERGSSREEREERGRGGRRITIKGGRVSHSSSESSQRRSKMAALVGGFDWLETRNEAGDEEEEEEVDDDRRRGWNETDCQRKGGRSIKSDLEVYAARKKSRQDTQQLPRALKDFAEMIEARINSVEDYDNDDRDDVDDDDENRKTTKSLTAFEAMRALEAARALRETRMKTTTKRTTRGLKTRVASGESRRSRGSGKEERERREREEERERREREEERERREREEERERREERGREEDRRAGRTTGAEKQRRSSGGAQEERDCKMMLKMVEMLILEMLADEDLEPDAAKRRLTRIRKMLMEGKQSAVGGGGGGGGSVDSLDEWHSRDDWLGKRENAPRGRVGERGTKNQETQVYTRKRCRSLDCCSGHEFVRQQLEKLQQQHQRQQIFEERKQIPANFSVNSLDFKNSSNNSNLCTETASIAATPAATAAAPTAASAAAPVSTERDDTPRPSGSPISDVDLEEVFSSLDELMLHTSAVFPEAASETLDIVDQLDETRKILRNMAKSRGSERPPSRRRDAGVDAGDDGAMDAASGAMDAAGRRRAYFSVGEPGVDIFDLPMGDAASRGSIETPSKDSFESGAGFVNSSSSVAAAGDSAASMTASMATTKQTTTTSDIPLKSKMSRDSSTSTERGHSTTEKLLNKIRWGKWAKPSSRMRVESSSEAIDVEALLREDDSSPMLSLQSSVFEPFEPYAGDEVEEKPKTFVESAFEFFESDIDQRAGLKVMLGMVAGTSMIVIVGIVVAWIFVLLS